MVWHALLLGEGRMVSHDAVSTIPKVFFFPKTNSFCFTKMPILDGNKPENPTQKYDFGNNMNEILNKIG